MGFQGKKIGFALTGSFCTFAEIMEPLRALVNSGAEVVPIMSEASYGLDTRFGAAAYWQEAVMAITGNKIIHSIQEAEPIGPKALFDLVVVAPCTGNTIAKLANSISDTTVTMAAKAHLRNGRPLLLAISTNDGLGINAKNIGMLMAVKNVYLVPFGQDNPQEKPTSVVADPQLILEAAAHALENRQLQPVLIAR